MNWFNRDFLISGVSFDYKQGNSDKNGAFDDLRVAWVMGGFRRFDVCRLWRRSWEDRSWNLIFQLLKMSPRYFWFYLLTVLFSRLRTLARSAHLHHSWRRRLTRPWPSQCGVLWQRWRLFSWLALSTAYKCDRLLPAQPQAYRNR